LLPAVDNDPARGARNWPSRRGGNSARHLKLTSVITMATTRLALFSSLGLALAAASADASPRVVVLAFDGPKELADSGWKSVVSACKDYDLIPASRWKKELASASRDLHGPSQWKAAAKKAGVDAIVEGWVQDAGRQKQLVIVVHDATSGVSSEDRILVKLGADGLAKAAEQELVDGLTTRINEIGEHAPAVASYEVVDRAGIGGRQKPGYKGAKPEGTQQVADKVEEPAPPPTAPTNELGITVQGPACTDPLAANCAKPADVVVTVPPPKAAPYTPRFRFSGGPYLGSRSLTFNADAVENVTQFTGVDTKGFALQGELFPFPVAKNGQLSGLGFTLGVYQSMGATVGIDDDETTGDYAVNQNGFIAAVHWRQPIGKVTLDGEVGYSQDNYTIEDPPEGFEVPDTAYRAVHAGFHVDLNVAPRTSIGFGGRYHYILGQGDLTSTEFYGPGASSAYSVDAHFVVPLPQKMFIKGAVEYKKVLTEFAGGGLITDDEDVFDGTDSSVTANVSIGISF
jgi:hypothetical protein